MNYWLFKSEPDAFSVDDLARARRAGSPWDGVRNYQARNMMRDAMKVGDLGFFYHSSCEVPAIVGVVRIVRAGYPERAALDPKSRYFD
ncbi:MAG TPA: EVE domain-containing protein, partial [Steroidobacteraceae bacterium]|nr:EVE domain-containing protein [Steroidobacteraceae bacterium]